MSYYVITDYKNRDRSRRVTKKYVRADYKVCTSWHGGYCSDPDWHTDRKKKRKYYSLSDDDDDYRIDRDLYEIDDKPTGCCGSAKTYKITKLKIVSDKSDGEKSDSDDSCVSDDSSGTSESDSGDGSDFDYVITDYNEMNQHRHRQRNPDGSIVRQAKKYMRVDYKVRFGYGNGNISDPEWIVDKERERIYYSLSDNDDYIDKDLYKIDDHEFTGYYGRTKTKTCKITKLKIVSDKSGSDTS